MPVMDGTGTSAIIVSPEQIALSGKTLYVRDSAGLIRKIDTDTGVVTTLTGTTGATVPRDGPRGVATIETALNGGGLVPTADGGLMVTETQLFLGAVRRVDAAGVVTTIAVAHPFGFSGFTPGTAVLAQLPFVGVPDDLNVGGLSRFANPVAVAAAPNGSLVVGSRTDVRRIAPDGGVSPVIGLQGVGSFDGKGSAADVLNASQAMVVDAAGVIYFSDVSTIRSIDSTRTARTIAGAASVFGDSSGQGQGAVDGPGATARFSNVTGLARAASGDLYASDSQNFAIRRIDPAGNVSTFAGVLGQKGTDDGPRASARFTGPTDVAVAPDGSLWVLDGGRNATPSVRRIAPDGTVSTLPPLVKRLAVDPAGTIYVLSEAGDLASMDPSTGALTVLVQRGTQLSFGSDPRLGGDSNWAFTAVGIKQLVLMSDHQLIRVTLP
jgi:sugar lactone lactonase YvrE